MSWPVPLRIGTGGQLLGQRLGNDGLEIAPEHAGLAAAMELSDCGSSSRMMRAASGIETLRISCGSLPDRSSKRITPRA